MKKKTKRTARLGDLIAAVFDEAARFSTDRREVSRLAAEAVRHLMRRARRLSPTLLPEVCPEPVYSYWS